MTVLDKIVKFETERLNMNEGKCENCVRCVNGKCNVEKCSRVTHEEYIDNNFQLPDEKIATAEERNCHNCLNFSGGKCSVKICRHMTAQELLTFSDEEVAYRLQIPYKTLEKICYTCVNYSKNAGKCNLKTCRYMDEEEFMTLTKEMIDGQKYLNINNIN